ncbi:MAG: hypothetical protein R8G66_02285 [Cytophagales bacterium]|nr:hypothetical protein [Cytophagales bacterium]
MEDFKIWVYLAFAAIYLISRAMKKKEPEKKPRSPLQTADEQSPRRKAPASFEELLKEFTEEHERQETEERQTEEPVVQPVSSPARPTLQEEIRLEGEKRHFADDESRAIYERSIQEAEGAHISYERDEHFKMKRFERQEEENEIASELRNMLKSPSEAKKAVILSEILNRRY